MMASSGQFARDVHAYTGARVNAITSLLPSDVQQIMKHGCFPTNEPLCAFLLLRIVGAEPVILLSRFTFVTVIWADVASGNPTFSFYWAASWPCAASGKPTETRRPRPFRARRKRNLSPETVGQRLHNRQSEATALRSVVMGIR